MVQKYGVHGLAYSVVAAECKRQIAEASAHTSAGEILFYSAGGVDEVKRIPAVSVYTCGYGEDVGVKYYVGG